MSSSLTPSTVAKALARLFTGVNLPAFSMKVALRAFVRLCTGVFLTVFVALVAVFPMICSFLPYLGRVLTAHAGRWGVAPQYQRWLAHYGRSIINDFGYNVPLVCTELLVLLCRMTARLYSFRLGGRNCPCTAYKPNYLICVVVVASFGKASYYCVIHSHTP